MLQEIESPSLRKEKKTTKNRILVLEEQVYKMMEASISGALKANFMRRRGYISTY